MGCIWRKGGHSSGVFYTKSKKKLYLHLGGHRDAVSEAEFQKEGNYNGGGMPARNNDAPGGGASDFRKKEGNWNETLESRILVAGGGGGGRIAHQGYYKGGDGGGLNGTSGQGMTCPSFYGTQSDSKGGDNCDSNTLNKDPGEFGIGGEGYGTGGGGYFGGSVMQNAGGGGGSGYIDSSYFLESFQNYKTITETSDYEGSGRAKITIILIFSRTCVCKIAQFSINLCIITIILIK